MFADRLTSASLARQLQPRIEALWRQGYIVNVAAGDLVVMSSPILERGVKHFPSQMLSYSKEFPVRPRALPPPPIEQAQSPRRGVPGIRARARVFQGLNGSIHTHGQGSPSAPTTAAGCADMVGSGQ